MILHFRWFNILTFNMMFAIQTMSAKVLSIPLASGLAYIVFAGYLASMDEMLSQGDKSGAFLLYLAALTYFLVLMLIFILWSIVNLFRRKWQSAGMLFFCAILPLLLPVVTPLVTGPLSTAAQIRYIDRFGREQLRAEVSEFLQSDNSSKGPMSYFGLDVPPEYCPPILVEFARGRGLEVTSNGVVYRTDGLGSWRGGYLITPSGSDYEPSGPGSRKIIDGFYYVISR